MSSHNPVLDGDLAIFNPLSSFPGIMLIGNFIGNISTQQDKVTLSSKNVCITSDIERFSLVTGYNVIPAFPVPGQGKITIKKLSDDQIAHYASINGNKILLCGSQFSAEFSVTMPAILVTPAGVQKDPTSKYTGNGVFQNVTINFTEISG